jgi:hypothetical protein
MKLSLLQIGSDGNYYAYNSESGMVVLCEIATLPIDKIPSEVLFKMLCESLKKDRDLEETP